MNKEDQAKIIAQMQKLNKLLYYHSKKYHQDDQPEISDFQYDLLFNELKQLEKSYPSLKLTNSVSQKVGYKPKRGFASFTHPVLMGSLDNAMNFDELKNFVDKRNHDLNTKVSEYYLSLKLDGLALELIYQKGNLSVASTRGDGTVGENITTNALMVENIPQKLDLKNVSIISPTLVVRGEVIMTISFFNELNECLQQEGEEPFANPRNAAAGTMRQLDSNIVKTRKLFFFPYGLTNWEDTNLFFERTQQPLLLNHDEQLGYINSLGFTLNPHYTIAKDYTDIESFCKSIEKQRYNFDYGIDGVVVKINSGELQNKLGEAGRRPRYAIAWKLPPEIKETILEDVIFQVGRTGKITPVAILKPITIGGAVVRRASLHNFNEIKAKGVYIGAHIKIIRSGDVIPKILGILNKPTSLQRKDIVLPINCPICNSLLKTEKSGLLTFCKNNSCGSRQYYNIVHFASKDAMNIEGLGKEHINDLIIGGKIKDAGDLYTLAANDLNVLKRVGDKLKSNLLNSINESRNPSLHKFIYALGITGVGEKTAKILAKKFITLDTLISQPKEILLNMNEIGEVMANNISDYFSNQINRKLIEKILKNGVSVLPYREQANIKRSKINNKKILFTGTLNLPRNRAKELAEKAGAEIVSSVTKQLDYLVIGENPGSKKRKAEELYITIITEEDFMKLISD